MCADANTFEDIPCVGCRKHSTVSVHFFIKGGCNDIELNMAELPPPYQ